MFSVFIRRLPYSVIAVVLVVTATLSACGTAAADPGQDQKFFDLLDQQEIPPVDGDDGLITTAHKVCSKLDEGVPVGELVETIRNNGFNDNPLTRLQNQGRITRTIDRFINAAVQAYCPNDRAKIASIAAFHGRPSNSRLLVLASFVEPLPAGEIGPTKPIPVPAQPPPQPQQIEPPPRQQAPPPVRRVQPAPPQQAEPPPAAPPPAESPPDAGPPAEAPAPAPPAEAPAPAPAPASPTPDQPSPPGHIRLAP